MDPPVGNVTLFFTKGGHLDPPIVNNMFFNQGGQLDSPVATRLVTLLFCFTKGGQLDTPFGKATFLFIIILY